ncbi:DNA repair protein SWI5 homolog [Drosophila pseudoobscura]|uniref:DNA repair protein SWI5 homolog n=1 Tax=Drosophila pseudoobscura pseudoobscura TaxID=46245 RepID=A0A0R3P7W0_DROPS|nr:DNA repair protein SWI5 homolog [Drosophila pseudoobscura]
MKSSKGKARRKAKKQINLPDSTKVAQLKHIMKLMHEYNNLKDATQLVIGALAAMKNVSIRSTHEMYDLPNNE